MIVLFTASIIDSLHLRQLVSFTFLINTEIQSNFGDRLCTWKVTVLPTTLSGEYWASLHQPPSLRSTNTLQSLLEEESHSSQSQESEENWSQTPTQWHTAPNSPLLDLDTLDLPNAWEGSEIEDKFYELEQHHLEFLIEEEAAQTWREENSDWYNDDFIEAS